MQPLLWRAPRSRSWLSLSTWHHLSSGRSRRVKLRKKKKKRKNKNKKKKKVRMLVQPPTRHQLPQAWSVCSHYADTVLLHWSELCTDYWNATHVVHLHLIKPQWSSYSGCLRPMPVNNQRTLALHSLESPVVVLWQTGVCQHYISSVVADTFCTCW